MTRFSANLGFLWTDRSLPEAIHAAKAAGFDAVECHWPYATPAEDVKAALDETGLTMLGLNTDRGDTSIGENGLSALDGRQDEARGAIDQSIAYATAIGTRNIHIMAGFAQGDTAQKTFIDNLRYATDAAAAHGITMLIEPLNHYDAPFYFLQTTNQAKQIIENVGAPNLKLMFDCYHVQLMEGDLTRKITDLLPIIGHIQFAGVPARGVPDEGEVAYGHIFDHIAKMGYEAPLGAEYKPVGDTDQSLAWMKTLG
jgi:hydroxypyruvate isomerase